jgi:Leucine-rich repeat (LRR) protein
MLKLPKLPNSLKILACGDNELTKVKLPPQLEELYCSRNQIQRLDLPASLKILYCYQNKIETLILPDTLEELNCGNNQLSTLSLPGTLKKLDCSKNKISLLKLNEQLIRIDLSYNPFVSVPKLPKGLQSINFKFTQMENCFEITDTMIDFGYLFLYGSPLYTKIKAVVKTDEHISCPVVIKMAFQLIDIIEHRFKRTYYSMKAKARMLAWMWRARETIAMKKYHPDELLKRLDDYDALDMW